MRRSLLASACAFVSLAGLGSLSEAALVFDVQALSASGPGVTVNGPKSVSVTATGGTINFIVVAQVSPGSANDAFQQARGKLNSVGGIKGNLGTPTMAATWRTGAWKIGQSTDNDGDGDLDLGSPSQDVSLSVIPRADPLNLTIASVNQFYSFSMLVTQLGSSANVNWTNTATGINANWRENGATRFASTGTIQAGLPVVLSQSSKVSLLADSSFSPTFDDPAYENIYTYGANEKYVSTVLDTAVNASSGRVDILGSLPTPVTDTPVLVLVDLADLTPGDGINDVANFLANLGSIEAGTGSGTLLGVEISGKDFNALLGAYGPGFDVLFRFDTPAGVQAGNLDFAWDFNAFPNVGIDRILAVPEPTGLMVLGASLAILYRRSRRVA